MHRTYKIVKKNSTDHQEALDSKDIKKTAIIDVAGTHVLIPTIRHIDRGHNVSHAKNRTKRLRMPNKQTLRVEHFGQQLRMKLTARDLRTYKKLTEIV